MPIWKGQHRLAQSMASSAVCNPCSNQSWNSYLRWFRSPKCSKYNISWISISRFWNSVKLTSSLVSFQLLSFIYFIILELWTWPYGKHLVLELSTYYWTLKWDSVSIAPFVLLVSLNKRNSFYLYKITYTHNCLGPTLGRWWNTELSFDISREVVTHLIIQCT